MPEKFINQINTFNDFYQLTKNFTNKQKGDLFEDFTKYIFIFHPYYINLTKKIWLFEELPLKLKKQLNIPDNDEGIDLVMLSKEDKYYAIQSKFRTKKDTKIKWEELGTFVGLSFGVAKGFEKGFFVTNTTKINKNILNSDKIVPIFGDFFDDLPENLFLMIKSKLINNHLNVELY